MWAKLPGWLMAVGIVLFISMVMAIAVFSGLKTDCFNYPWYRLPGCSIALYENLSGGLIAAGGALFAGWLAWSAVSDQIAIEREKARAEKLAALERRADEFSSELAKMQTAASKGAALLRALREDLKDPAPYATRLVDLNRQQMFPPSSDGWTSHIIGSELWEAVYRIKELARDIEQSSYGEQSITRPAYLQKREVHASEAVANLNSYLSFIPERISQLQNDIAAVNNDIQLAKVAAPSA